ncbi:hypothetical protein LOD99_4508 [Oopsacas minuta]|uniref:Uncharacterized protein n=1 Tax=Oopsacas minuta TaxID=111878 RepID=A0AAV7JSV8_9METZ|nr:hypothetical protein LOD99_4508 [Oopsacas minuta]
MGNAPLVGVAITDIGTAVAAIFEKGLGEPGEKFGIASDHLLIEEMANNLSEVSGTQVRALIKPTPFKDWCKDNLALLFKN